MNVNIPTHGNRWKGGRISRICLTCGALFDVYPYKIKDGKGKYCSKKCMGVAQKNNPDIMAKLRDMRAKSSGNTGHHHTEESKQKMSLAKMGQPAWNKGKKLTKEHVKKFLARRTPSSLEEKFIGIINKHNLPYKFVGNGAFMIENYNPDFINVNGDKIAIEVYARFYKRKRFGDRIDEWKKERADMFKKYGWEIVYFDETEVNEENVLGVLNDN